MRTSEETQSQLPTAFNSSEELHGKTESMMTPNDESDLEKAIEASEPVEPTKPTADPTLVVWDGPHDPENPYNWPRSKKWRITVIAGLMTFCTTFASSVFSTGTVQVAAEYGVSTEVSTLGTSLFVLGFATGPILWGPLSEVMGRKYPMFLGYFIFMIFNIPVAVAQNLYTIMLTRFFGGMFGCAPLVIIGGMLADFFDPVDRGVAVAVFAVAVFIGPMAGPIAGGFISQSYLGWRWTAWITTIMAAFFGFIGFIWIPESSHAKLLQQRAKKLRYETKNWAIHSKADEEEIDMKRIVTVYLVRPFAMLVQEPILTLITLYMSLIYGILYLFFEAFPISYQEQRGWNEGVGALPFLFMGAGVLIGAVIITVVTKTRFKRLMIKHGRVIPEERLPPMILGAVLMPIGLFWFAWTSNPHINWVAQGFAAIPIGTGIIMIFLQSLNYIIDVYLTNANSAIAANTLLRSFAGAGFPLFAVPMFENLGVDWATTLLAFLCVALAPVPILFYLYGHKLRAMSKHSVNIPH